MVCRCSESLTPYVPHERSISGYNLPVLQVVLPLCDSFEKWYGMGKKWYYHSVNLCGEVDSSSEPLIQHFRTTAGFCMARFDEAKKAIFDARSPQKRQIFAAARRKRTYKAFGWWGQQPFEWIDRFSELFHTVRLHLWWPVLALWLVARPGMVLWYFTTF